MLRLVVALLLVAPAACASGPTSSRFGNVQTLGSRPSFDYSTTLGCADVAFHAVNVTETEFLQIEADFSQIASRATRQTFDLSRAPDGVKVAVTLYSRPQINRPNCSDVFIRQIGAPPLVVEVWPAVRGRLIVERGPNGINLAEPWLF